MVTLEEQFGTVPELAFSVDRDDRVVSLLHPEHPVASEYSITLGSPVSPEVRLQIRSNRQLSLPDQSVFALHLAHVNGQDQVYGRLLALPDTADEINPHIANQVDHLNELAHDMNNVFTSVTGNIDVTVMDLPDYRKTGSKLIAVSELSDAQILALRPQQIRDLFRLSGKRVERSYDQIGDNLECSKRATEKLGHMISTLRGEQYDPEDFDLNYLVARNMRGWDTYLQDRITVNSECDQKVLNVHGSRGELHRCISNLLANTKHHAFLSRGEVKISTGLEWISLVEDLDSLEDPYKGLRPFSRVSVSDNGKGINPEIFPHMFERGRTPQDNTNGYHGFGLSSTLEIVKEHFGHIRVNTFQDRGTTFDILLPYLGNTDQN
mgnify:FL=1